MSLERITQLAQLLVEQEGTVAELEKQLSKAKLAALQTKRTDLPELMREFGLLDFRLTSGERIEIKEDIECRITDDTREEAHRWLIDHGFGSLIKTAVTIEFSRGDVEQAEDLARKLIEDDLPAFVAEVIHPATLKAFINEQIAAGNSVPFDLFKIVPFSFAKINRK